MLNWRAHLLYWVIPVVVIGIMIAMYFSGIGWLMSIVAPVFSREFGLLENLQALLIAAIIGMAGWRGLHSHSAQRIFFILVAAGSLFMLLEELDYGTHFLWAIQGWDPATRPVINIHNQGDATDKFKHAGDVILVLWFVIFPFTGRWLNGAWVRFLRPSRMFVLSVLAAYLLSRLTHWLNANMAPSPNPLDTGISEFRELFTYYIAFFYIATLAFARRWSHRRTADAA